MEFQEPPWSFEQEEMLSIGIEEVSNTSRALRSCDTDSSYWVPAPSQTIESCQAPVPPIIIIYVQGAGLVTFMESNKLKSGINL